MDSNYKLMKAKMLYMQVNQTYITPTMLQLHEWLEGILWDGIVQYQPKPQGGNSTPICSDVGAKSPPFPTMLVVSDQSQDPSIDPSKPAGQELQTAQYLYMKAKGTTEPPSLEELISWLCKRGSVDYSRRLRYTLDRIDEELAALGPIDFEGEVRVPGMLILRIRTSTQSVPRRPRNKKKA